MAKELIIVGTSHISKESVENVKNAIEGKSPDIVGVELDIYRYRGLVADAGKKKTSPGLSYIRKIGVKGFIFALVGSLGTRKLAKYVGAKPGEDMLESVNIAKRNNIKVALIDQNIQTTLSSFSNRLSKREIARFFFDILKGLVNPKGELKKLGIYKFDLKKVPSEELVEKMINHMKNRFPNVYDVLVHKRNIYMAKNIMKIMKQEDVEKMVAVVGAGHRKGIQEILENQSSAEFYIHAV